MIRLTVLSLSFICLFGFVLSASDCTTYRKEADGACADTCLGDTEGLCPTSIIVQYGGLSKGSCNSDGFTKADGSISQAAGPCGTLTFNKWVKPSLRSSRGVSGALERALSQLTTITEDAVTEVGAFFDRGSCPDTETVDVDVAEYFNGRWYEIAASSTFKTQFEEGLQCITADYTLNKCDTKHPVVVVNSGIKEDGSSNPAIGKARQAGPGKFEVSFFGPFYGPYWVIYTESSPDHNIAVALVFSCSVAGQDMWVLSRTPELPATGSSYDDLLSIASTKGVNVDALGMIKTEQGDSCKYPDPDAINQKPSSDDGCTFGWTGCSPSAWCSWQFKWGDLTPSQSCRLKPTDCAETVEVVEAPVEVPAEPVRDQGKSTSTKSSSASVEVPIVVVVAGVAMVVASTMFAFVVKRRSSRINVSEPYVRA
eukprot:c9316_g1_i1.p1 GENE.c9316_g1_i1~~c9316_g1_i1.p1  ORF type:complete len:425 (+),score=80.29 c9316_g1_i1:67-1341(+)